jgi:hypothetical protein
MRLLLRVKLSDGTQHHLQPEGVPSEELEKRFLNGEEPFHTDWIKTVDDVAIRRADVVSVVAMRAIDAYS